MMMRMMMIVMMIQSQSVVVTRSGSSRIVSRSGYQWHCCCCCCCDGGAASSISATADNSKSKIVPATAARDTARDPPPFRDGDNAKRRGRPNIATSAAASRSSMTYSGPKRRGPTIATAVAIARIAIAWHPTGTRRAIPTVAPLDSSRNGSGPCHRTMRWNRGIERCGARQIPRGRCSRSERRCEYEVDCYCYCCLRCRPARRVASECNSEKHLHQSPLTNEPLSPGQHDEGHGRPNRRTNHPHRHYCCCSDCCRSDCCCCCCCW
mmetsp:Transcript_16245/g.35638  ORF Transcript_16245/g.35638 Transcript_16245/m.35638 type:complete len:265 (+) Transcript_16245:2-796(+)